MVTLIGIKQWYLSEIKCKDKTHYDTHHSFQALKMLEELMNF